MALQKGRVAIPLSKGINQKIDPKQEPPGSLKELQNVQVDKFGEIEKRDGYEKVRDTYNYGGTTLGGGTYNIPFSNVRAVTSYDNGLYIFDKDLAVRDSQSLGKALFTGKYCPAKVKTTFVTQNQQFSHNNVNCVVKDGFIYSAYDEVIGSTSSQMYVSVKNLETGFVFVDNVQISGTAVISRPKFVAIGDKIALFAIGFDSGTSVYSVIYKLITPLNYSSITTGSFTVAYNVHIDKIYDVTVNDSGTTGLLTYKGTGATNSIVPFFISPTSSTALGFGYTFTGTNTVTAVAVNKVPLKLYAGENLLTEDPSLGGFVAVSIDSTGVGVTTLDPEGGNIIYDGGMTTTFDILPDSICVSPRGQKRGDSTSGYVINTYFGMTVTGTGTGTSTNVLYMIDNSTGTYAADTIISTDFSGGNDYIKTGTSATSAWSGITYANFPEWNKRRIGRCRIDLNSTGGTTSGNLYTFELIAHQLVSAPFVLGDATPVLPVGRSTPTQDSYFLFNGVDEDEFIEGKPLGLLGYSTSASDYVYSNDWTTGYPSPPHLAFNGDTVILPGLRKSKIISNDNAFFSLSTPTYTEFEFTSEVANQNEEMGRNLLVAGSQVFNDDTSRLAEHGFLQNPETLYVHTENMVSTGTGHPFTSGQSYNYRAVYKYEDNKGNIHRSGLSPQLSFQLAANYQNIDIIVPMVNLTNKYNVSTFIELYRTTNGGTLFYKVSDLNVSSTVYACRNNKLYNYIKIKDTTTNDDLQQQELLYTTGGVLENTPVGAASIMESYKNRIFLGGLEEQPNRLLFSKVSSNFVPVEFSDSLTVEVPEPGGKLVALKRMDDKLIIFKERAIYMLTGEGPNNLGEQNDFIEPQLITSDIGCKFANSVAFMPKGLMFMSHKGIFLLNRSLGIEYIGAPAEDYKDATITKTTVVPKKSEVRFLASDGPTAIYNYFLNMWYTYSDHRGPSSCLVGNDYFLATFKDKVYKQVNTTASFDGASVPMKIETGWLSFAGIQGYQRVYRMLLLGEYKSPHKLLIKIAYNYDDVWQQEKLVDVTSYTESYTYGGPTTGTQQTYGDPSGTSAIAYGGKDNTQYQIRLNFAKQKCESVKICIQEIEGSNPSGDSESAGPGFTLSNLSFIVGTKEGDFKIKQSRVFGSTSIT